MIIAITKWIIIFFYECMLLNFMVNDANYLIYIFYTTHNVQLG